MKDKSQSPDNPLADIAIFWPTFAIFVALLITVYILTAP